MSQFNWKGLQREARVLLPAAIRWQHVRFIMEPRRSAVSPGLPITGMVARLRGKLATAIN